MSTKRKWKVYCNQEATLVATGFLPESVTPDFCPNDVSHTIDSARSSVMDSVDPLLRSDSMLTDRATANLLVDRESGEAMIRIPE